MIATLLLSLLAQTPPSVALTTPDEMLEHGRLSKAEYKSLVEDLSNTLGTKAGEGNTFAVSKFALTLYGFVQANALYDTTQSFTDQMGNGLVARPGTYAGTHDRFQLSARHSRFGLRLKAPEWHDMRASAVMEFDFLGNQPPVGTGQPYFTTEASFITNPSLRARHLYLKVETPYLDVLIGQYWAIFGGQPAAHPNGLEIQGVPGQLFARMPQIRLSRMLRSDPVNVELVVGAVRPVERDSGLPDGQAAIRLLLNKWTGFTTSGAVGSSLQPASLSVSGDVRSVRLPEFSAAPMVANSALGGGFAADLMLPILPATAQSRAGALTLVGEFAWGKGTADMYSGLNGGVTMPALPNPTGATPAPVYAQSIDNGVATYDQAGELHLIQWTTWHANLQYYLPFAEGKVWLAAIYSHTWSPSTASYGGPRTRKTLDYFSGTIFADVLPSVRLGLEYARTIDRGNDDVVANNNRINFCAFYIF